MPEGIGTRPGWPPIGPPIGPRSASFVSRSCFTSEGSFGPVKQLEDSQTYTRLPAAGTNLLGQVMIIFLRSWGDLGPGHGSRTRLQPGRGLTRDGTSEGSRGGLLAKLFLEAWGTKANKPHFF